MAAAGALPYAGDPSPAGVHGFWYENTTFPALSVTEVAGDMVIAPGTTVTFEPGATFNMATTDAMAGGLDPNRVEIRVEGTLEADGTNSRPVVFTSAAASPARRDWYGIVIPSNAEAFGVAQVDIGYAFRGVSLYSNNHIVAGSEIHDCSDAAIYIDGGAPSIEDMVLHDNGTGMSIQDSPGVTVVNVDAYRNVYGADINNATVTWNRGRIFDNSNHGIRQNITANGNWVLTLRNLTIAHNGTGLRFMRNSSYSGRSLSVQLFNTSITHNTSGGVVDGATSNSYRAALSCSGSNVWGNSPNYSNTSTAACISLNPLYADEAARDYAPTVHSPNRALGGGGGHIGALPYAGALGPQLMGYLWDDFTFTAANSPYTILGDITVPPGSTVRFEPGAELHFANLSDGMGGGNSANRSEFNIAGGDVIMDGSGAPIVMRVAEENATSGNWRGIKAEDAGGSILDNLRVEHASIGLHIVGPSSPKTQRSVFISNGTGVRVEDVTSASHPFDLLACDVIGNGNTAGVILDNSHGSVRSSYITHTNTAIDVNVTANGAWVANLINNTLVHQAIGIRAQRNTSYSGRTLTVNVTNNVVANSSSRALQDAATSTSYRSQIYLRNNNWFNTTSTVGTFALNSGNRTTDPLIEDDDWEAVPRWWDGKLWANSLAIDRGYGGGTLPPFDRLGNPRVIGSAVDIGAFEFDPSANQEPRADDVATAMMVPTGESFTLDGSDAYDPDGTIASAYWTFSDGTVIAGINATHTLASAGSRWAYITVIDDQGAEDHALVQLNVNNRPIADAGPQVFQDEGPDESVYFDGTGSTDTDGTLVRYEWDFGDGTPIATGTNPRHSYLSAGNYVVTLTVTDNEGLSHSDTTLATVFGTVDTTGPLVQHVEIADGQPLGAPVTISATVTDPAGVQSVILYHRPIGTTVAKFVIMTNTSGDTYEGVIAGADVPAEGVEYWIQAVDEGDRDSITPAGAPTSAVWDFLVTGDPNPPLIAHTPIADGQTNGEALTISANITDETGVGSANLYFRTQGGASFGAVSMSNIVGTTWSAQLPGFVVAPPGVEYYIEATDTSPLPNLGRAPAGTALYRFTVSASGDTAPPVISHAPITDGQAAGVPVTIAASIVDAEGSVSGATVMYRISGSGGVFTPAAMVNTSAANWSAVIPGAAVTEAGVDYYLVAADDADNDAFAPAGAPGAVYAFTVTPADTAGPSITHIPVTDGQEIGTNVSVSASVTDPSGVNRVEIRYRPTGVPIFSTIDMSLSGGEWTGQIPGFSVSPPSMEYYVRAYDEEGNQSTHPVSGQSSPHIFTVVEVDEDAPELVHTPVADDQLRGQDVSITASITDASALSVTLYYRAIGALSWNERDMPNTGGTGYGAAIPGASVGAAGVEYYIHAQDTAGNQTTSPPDAPTTVHAFTTRAADVTGPSLEHSAPSTLPAGDDIVISAEVADASGVSEVFVSWLSPSGAAELTLVNSGGITWSGTLPWSSLGTDPATLTYFIVARDTEGNQTTSPADAPVSSWTVTFVYPDTTPPTIALSAVPDGQAAGEPVAVAATAADDSGLEGVQLFYRVQGGSAWSETAFAAGLGERWDATIPGSQVSPPGVEYYAIARDTSGNSASAPAAGAAGPATFSVIPADTSAPIITHVPVLNGQAHGAPVAIVANIEDASGVASAQVFYRAIGASVFAQFALSASGDTWSGVLPGALIVEPGLEYYISATDAAGIANTTTHPASAPSTLHTFMVGSAPDTIPPSIVLVDPTGPFNHGVAITLGAMVTDASGVAQVTLNYRSEGASGWTQLPMNKAGDLFTASVPEEDVFEGELAWFVHATDTADNAATQPTEGASAPEVIVVEGVIAEDDLEPPTLLHTAITDARVNTPLSITAVATDASGLDHVAVYFRTLGEEAWTSLTLSAGEDDAFSGELPASALELAGLEYYLSAVDASLAGNEALLPADAPEDWFDVAVFDDGGDAGDDVGFDAGPDAGDAGGDASDVGIDGGDADLDAGDDTGGDVSDATAGDTGSAAPDDTSSDVGSDAPDDTSADAESDAPSADASEDTSGLGDVDFADGFDFDTDDVGAGLVDAGLPPYGGDSGCACSVQRSPSSAFGAGLVLAGLFLLRRRRA